MIQINLSEMQALAHIDKIHDLLDTVTLKGLLVIADVQDNGTAGDVIRREMCLRAVGKPEPRPLMHTVTASTVASPPYAYGRGGGGFSVTGKTS